MKKIFLFLLGAFVLLSCDPAKKAYSDLESFTEYIENNSATFTPKDWKDAEVEYNTIVQNVDMQVYTDEERVAIGKLKGRCSMLFTKNSMKNVRQGVNDFILEAEGFLEAVFDELSGEDTVENSDIE